MLHNVSQTRKNILADSPQNAQKGRHGTGKNNFYFPPKKCRIKNIFPNSPISPNIFLLFPIQKKPKIKGSNLIPGVFPGFLKNYHAHFWIPGISPGVFEELLCTLLDFRNFPGNFRRITMHTSGFQDFPGNLRRITMHTSGFSGFPQGSKLIN